MNQPRKPKKVKAPEGCESYLIAGKEYDVVKIDKGHYGHNGYGIYVTNENGHVCECLQFKCPHLNGKDWIVTEYED